MKTPFKGRREDGRLITGNGRYTADWDLPIRPTDTFYVPIGRTQILFPSTSAKPKPYQAC